MKNIPTGQKSDRAGDSGSLIPESNFRLLFESLPGQFLILDPEFRIVAASDAYLSATMTKREEILGHQMFEIFPDNPADPRAMGVRNLEASFRKVRRTGKPDAMSLQKYDVRRPEEEGGGFDERYWSPVNSPVFSADGRLLYIVHRVEDVTDFVRQKEKGTEQEERADELQLRLQRMDAEVYARAREAAEAHVQLKQADEELARLYEKTKELDRLKTEFFANISHELRTPLTLILGPAERWLREGEVSGRLRRDLEVMYRNASLLLRHVNNLLDVARLEAGQMILRYVHTNLARLVWFLGSAFDSFAAERNISYKIDAPKILEAQIDPEKVQRVLVNLISNAIKFTPSGGSITLSLRKEGRNAVVRVTDTGPGIPVSLREKIFDRFERLERGDQPQAAGTGLGLAIVRDFVNLHGGQAWVDEAPGGGAVFTVSLPLEAPAGTLVQEELKNSHADFGQEVGGEFFAQTLPPPGPLPVAPPDAPLVLVVDDNRDMAAFEAEVLGRSYRVVTAFDGVEGLEKALELRPDLIVSDVMMPRMSGDEMAGRLQEIPELQDTPVLVVTARADEEFRLKILREPLRSYLVKPFSVQELLARAEGLVTERKLQQALRESERQYRVLFENSPLPRWTLDMENFRILQVNEAAIKSYGYSREEFQQLTLADIRPAEEFEKFRKWAEQCRAGEITMEGKVQTLHRKKNGELLDVIADINEVEFKGRRIILTAVVDITARKRAEEGLEEANRQLVEDLEAMKTLQELAMLFLHEKNKEQILNEIVQAAVRLSKADFGNIRIRDLASSSLRIAAHHGFPPWWLDYWNIVHYDKGACGVALERGERVIVEDIEKSPIFAGSDALEVQLKAGVRAVQCTPLFGRAGTLLGMVSTHYKMPHRPSDRELRFLDLLARQAADFIEQTQLNEQLEARAGELEEANRELQTFNYSVAHDLRQPLNIISGYCQAIKMLCGDKLDEECAGHLEGAYQGTLRMSRLIGALLNFSRLARVELQRETVDISKMAQELADGLRVANPERRVTFQILDGVTVEGDPSLLHAVLDNLIGNAWKYTSVRKEPIIEFGSAEIDGKTACFVRDNGTGFNMADAEKLFQPFKRLPEAEETRGFGIGLATVDRIIRRHGGKIWAVGEPGKGATFWFTLPA